MVAFLFFRVEGGMVAVLLVKVVADEKVESWSSEMVCLSKGMSDEKVVSWSSEVVVVGVFEEVFCRHQGMLVEVDVLVRA